MTRALYRRRAHCSRHRVRKHADCVSGRIGGRVTAGGGGRAKVHVDRLAVALSAGTTRDLIPSGEGASRSVCDPAPIMWAGVEIVENNSRECRRVLSAALLKDAAAACLDARLSPLPPLTLRSLRSPRCTDSGAPFLAFRVPRSLAARRAHSQADGLLDARAIPLPCDPLARTASEVEAAT